MQYAKLLSVHLQPGDKVIRKKLWKHAVTHVSEIRLLFKIYPEGAKMLVALGLLAIQIIRPIELSKLSWAKMVFSKEQDEILEFHHDVNKSGNRRNINSNTYLLKEVKKPMFSKWLSSQLIKYRLLYPLALYNQVFPWSTTDSITWEFKRLRQMVRDGLLGPEYNFLLEKNDDVLVGQATNTQYRVGPYALRRFACTFHYYVTFKCDIIKMAEFTGHARPETLLTHYIKPKEAIGLTQEMIDRNITIDEFIMAGACSEQILLPEFFDYDKPIFISFGQTRLADFI